jgi:hypothetical protein
MFYIIAIMLAFAWILTFFFFRSGPGVHILILMAVTCWLHAILTIPQKKYILGGMKEQGLRRTGKKAA